MNQIGGGANADRRHFFGEQMHIHEGPARACENTDVTEISAGQTIFFLDETVIGKADAVDRIWHLPEKWLAPVMTATKSWEIEGKYRCVGGFSGKSFIATPEKLMMFYSVYHNMDNSEYRCFAYAESEDGVNWVKPDLGDGTNLLLKNARHKSGRGPKVPYYEMQNVLYDETTGLYHCMGHCIVSKDSYGTFFGTSKDPTKWNKNDFRLAYPNEDIHSMLDFMTAYPRVMVAHGGLARRSIGISVKSEGKWGTPLPCHFPTVGDRDDYEIYNMPVEKAGGYILGFPIGFHRTGHGPLDTEFAYSRDYMHFEQPFGHMPYIPRGLPGEWDDCYIMSAAPVNFKGKTMFYYWGCNFPHDKGFKEERENNGSVGLATLPENRYCSLGCPRYSPGEVVTTWFEGKGKVKFDAQGSVQMDREDKGDRFRLRFKISDGQLFSFSLV